MWQWNCRGYRRKRGALTQFLATQEQLPDAIALQEAGCVPSLSGYVAFCQETTSEEENPRVSTLVSKHIPVIEHSLETSIPYVFLELLPQKRGHCSLFLLNVYSSPSKSKDTFNHLFRDALRIACPKDNNLLIVGDFNATHTTLGYAKASAKGRKLMDAIDVYRLTLLNEPDQPTRIGNSISRDTCPDLTLARTRDSCSWTNLGESLGSDHLILETEVPVQLNRKRGKPQRLVNWDSFRQLRSAAAKGNPIRGDELALERWVRQIQEDVERATKTILTTDKALVVDPHLLHLWEARRSLTKRLETTKIQPEASGAHCETHAGGRTIRRRVNSNQLAQTLRPAAGYPRHKADLEPTSYPSRSDQNQSRIEQSTDKTSALPAQRGRRPALGNSNRAVYRRRP